MYKERGECTNTDQNRDLHREHGRNLGTDEQQTGYMMVKIVKGVAFYMVSIQKDLRVRFYGGVLVPHVKKKSYVGLNKSYVVISPT